VRSLDELGGAAPDALVRPPRPARPGLVELAAALLIVGGVLGVIGFFAGSAPEPDPLGPLSLLTLVLNLAQIAVGVALRFGRLWILGVNYVAVLAFLDLLASGASPLALMLAIAEIVVVAILFLKRPWFDAMRDWRAWTAHP
jgi:hypothetical protein